MGWDQIAFLQCGLLWRAFDQPYHQLSATAIQKPTFQQLPMATYGYLVPMAINHITSNDILASLNCPTALISCYHGHICHTASTTALSWY